MKKMKHIFSYILLTIVMIGCSVPDGVSDDVTSLNSITSGNENKIIDISNDNSGKVKITPLGEGFTEHTIKFGHGSGVNASAKIPTGSSSTHVYPEGTYNVTIESSDIAGKITSKVYPFTITYRAPENLTVTKNFQGNSLVVSATADYATSFLVYYGDVSNEVGTPMAIGETLPAHNYVAGTYTITVVALSGGVATTSNSQTITIYNPFSLPITYEDVNQNYGIGGTFGGVNVAKVANPFPGGINTSNNVWKYTKPAGAESWSGTWTPLSTPNGTPINIDNGNKIKVMVYSTEVGKMLNVELEQASGGLSNQVLKVASTVANQWEELTFDFSSVPAGTTFKQLVFRYNDSASGIGEIIYIDNVTQSN